MKGLKGFMAVGAVFALAGRLLAQQQQQQDPLERDVQRLKDRLTLTDDQVTKAREVIKKEREDVRAFLTDEQKKAFDEGSRLGQQPGRGNGNPQQGGTTGFRGGWYPTTDEMKKELTLSDDEVTKINAIRDGVRQEMTALFRNRRGQGGGQDTQAAMDKLRDDTTKKMRDVLTDEQKPKFDEQIKAYRAQQDAANANRPARGGPGGAGGPFGGTVDERVTRAMEALKVDNANEADAIKTVVKKVIELMDKLDGYQRDARGKVDESIKNTELSDKAIGDKIDEIHKGQSEIEKDLKAARKDLGDIVTNRQELELIRRGILK